MKLMGSSHLGSFGFEFPSNISLIFLEFLFVVTWRILRLFPIPTHFIKMHFVLVRNHVISPHIYTGADVYILKQQQDQGLVEVLPLTVIPYSFISVCNTVSAPLKQQYISFIADNSYVKLSGESLDNKMKSSLGSASQLTLFVLLITTSLGNDRSAR